MLTDENDKSILSHSMSERKFDSMKSLAIEREYGSGGRQIGTKISEAAGIPYYDGNLMLEAAKNYGVSLDLLKEYDEQKTGSLLYNIALLSGYGQTASQSKAQGLFYGIQETIKRLEADGPAVFIGRCSTEILRENQDVVSVYIYSSDTDKRARCVSQNEGVTEAEALKLLERKDRQRREYFKFWTGREWSDRTNYDLELNTAKLSADECVKILLGAISFDKKD